MQAHRKALQVWVGEKKVGAIGIHISRGVAIHGISLNVNTDLSWYEAIVPCGHRTKPVTTLRDLLGEAVPMEAARGALEAQLTQRFGHGGVVHCDEAALLKDVGMETQK